MKKKKKPLDRKWVNELLGFIIGPQMMFMTMHAPKASEELTKILQGAVGSLYGENDYPDTNAWVVAASERVWELYNTYITAKLMKMYDDGVPDKPRIHLAPEGGKLN